MITKRIVQVLVHLLFSAGILTVVWFVVWVVCLFFYAARDPFYGYSEPGEILEKTPPQMFILVPLLLLCVTRTIRESRFWKNIIEV